jgi:MFS family permease
MKIAFSPTPRVDQWAVLDEITAGPKWYSPFWLWRQFNEHRVPLLRLAAYADFNWFGAHGYLLYALTFITLLLHSLLWAAFVRAAAGLPRLISMSIAGFFTFCIFCPNQIQNFYSAIQWTFVAAFFFASAAVIALSWFAGKQRPWIAIALASLAAFLAEGSLANGAFTWPILWLATFGFAFQWRHRAVLGGIGIAAIGLYMYHYWQPSYHSNPLETIRQPWHVSEYVLRYFDYSLSNYFVQAGFAAIVLSVAAGIALAILVRRLDTHAVGVALAAAMGFVLLTAVVTALGRLRLGIQGAQDSRYQTPVMLYWACAFAALMVAAWQLRSSRNVLILNAAALAAIFLPLGNLGPLSERVRTEASLVSFSGESLDRGVLDPVAEGILVIPMTVITRITHYLHAKGIALGPNPPRIPSSTVLANWSAKGCRGSLDTVSALSRFDPGPPEVRVDGWAINDRTHGPPDAVAIVDDHGTVLAENSLYFQRNDVLRAYPLAQGQLGWHIYVPLPKDARNLRAVAIVDHRGCPLGKVTPVNNETQ